VTKKDALCTFEAALADVEDRQEEIITLLRELGKQPQELSKLAYTFNICTNYV